MTEAWSTHAISNNRPQTSNNSRPSSFCLAHRLFLQSFCPPLSLLFSSFLTTSKTEVYLNLCEKEMQVYSFFLSASFFKDIHITQFGGTTGNVRHLGGIIAAYASICTEKPLEWSSRAWEDCDTSFPGEHRAVGIKKITSSQQLHCFMRSHRPLWPKCARKNTTTTSMMLKNHDQPPQHDLLPKQPRLLTTGHFS